eukprot:2449501-Prorocentrum_lima.AAC.1
MVAEHVAHELHTKILGIIKPAEFESFDRRCEYMKTTATQGGLVELDAACALYNLQVVVCVKAKNHFVVMGREGRRTATLDYDDGFWDLLS